jgi:hypothetical protein
MRACTDARLVRQAIAAVKPRESHSRVAWNANLEFAAPGVEAVGIDLSNEDRGRNIANGKHTAGNPLRSGCSEVGEGRVFNQGKAREMRPGLTT